MKHNVLTFLFLTFTAVAFSQTQENLLMERFFMNAFNPAYVGSEGKSIAIVTRTTWSGIAQAHAQTTYTIRVLLKRIFRLEFL